MLEIIQDYKKWKKTKREVQFCTNAMNEYQHKIEVKIPFDEWKRNVDRIKAFCDLLEPYKDDIAKFIERYEILSKVFKSQGCFVACCVPLKISYFGNMDIDVKNSSVRCINNRTNGDISEHICGDCDKFNQLVQYQVLAANAKTAQEREIVAKQVLLNHFKLFKIK